MCCQASGRECAMTLAVHLLNSRSTAGKRLAPTNYRVSVLAEKTFTSVGRSSLFPQCRPVLIGVGVRLGTGGAETDTKHARCIPLLQRLLTIRPHTLQTTILRLFIQVSGGRLGSCPSKGASTGFLRPCPVQGKSVKLSKSRERPN